MNSENGYRRLVYASVAKPDGGRRDHVEILRQSRANNGLDGISGFLWTDGRGYLQVLEGAPEAVLSVLGRITADPRHFDLRIVSDELGVERAFGDWTMASLNSERDVPMLRERVSRFLHDAPDDVRTAFGEAGL